MKLNRAKKWDDFVDAVHLINAPPLNISYADKSGNIGMCVTGKVPVRGRGKGQFPSPGWTGEYDWIGEIPVNEMPYTLNPNCGYIISTNNKPVNDDYPHRLLHSKYPILINRNNIGLNGLLLLINIRLVNFVSDI